MIGGRRSSPGRIQDVRAGRRLLLRSPSCSPPGSRCASAVPQPRARRRPRPVRAVGPRDRGRRLGARLRPEPDLPGVMAWMWGGLAALEPAFRTVTDSSDPAIRALTKVPATLAELGHRRGGRSGGSATGRTRRRSGRRRRAAVAGGLVRVRVVGPARGDLSCCPRCSPARGACPPAGSSPRRCGGQPDDQAGGAAVPGAVRGLVPRDAGPARDGQGAWSSAGSSSCSCGCRSSRRTARRTSSTTWPRPERHLRGALAERVEPVGAIQVLGADGDSVVDSTLAFGRVAFRQVG